MDPNAVNNPFVSRAYVQAFQKLVGDFVFRVVVPYSMNIKQVLSLRKGVILIFSFCFVNGLMLLGASVWVRYAHLSSSSSIDIV